MRIPRSDARRNLSFIWLTLFALLFSSCGLALDNQAKLLGSPEIAKTPIIGCDGLPDEGQDMVRTKKIHATVVMPPSSPQALEILSKYWHEGVRTLSAILPPTSFPPVDALNPR